MNQSSHKAVLYYTRLLNPEKLGPKGVSTAGHSLLLYALKDISSGFCGNKLPPFAYGPHGKPYFPDFPGIHFNISHSGEYVVVGVADVEIGVDIQEARISDPERLARTGKRVLSEEDYDTFLASSDRQTIFFREWVLREAYVKWTGEGLRQDLRTLPMDGWHRFVDIAPGYFCAVQAELPLNISVQEVTGEEPPEDSSFVRKRSFHCT